MKERKRTMTGGKYLAPVKLATVPSSSGKLTIDMGLPGALSSGPIPLERDGRMVFALPGGGEVLF